MALGIVSSTSLQKPKVVVKRNILSPSLPALRAVALFRVVGSLAKFGIGAGSNPDTIRPLTVEA